MGFLDNFRSRLASSGTASPTTRGFAELPDDNYQSVVGESHYDSALAATARICRPGEDGRPMFRAYVIAEPENPYDRDAIAIHSDRGKLGHLSRDDAQRYKQTMAALGTRGYRGATCAAFLNGGSYDRPNYGVVLKLAHPDVCELHLGIAVAPAPRRTATNATHVSTAGASEAAKLRGKHYTEFVDEVKVLRRHGHDDSAEKLLTELLDVVEAEAASEGSGVAPWYYEQLAIIYRKRKDHAAEVAVLERFAQMPHSPGAGPPKLQERLETARALAARPE